MAVDQTKQSFYGEVDRYRYRTNWGCLIWVLVAIVVLASALWWMLSKRR